MGTNNMADLRSLLSLFSFVLVYYGEVSSEFLESCRGLGFTESLVCSSCEDLDKFSLGKLKESCLGCCQDDSAPDTETEMFPHAELAVCGWKLGRYPQVQAFVKGDKPSQFSGLSIKYVRGADPIIKLMDEDFHVQQTFGIEKWDTDTIEAFLQSRLTK